MEIATGSYSERQQQQPRRPRLGRVSDIQRQERLGGRRRMSMSDLRTTETSSGLLQLLPRLFTRLVDRFSRSLASLSPSDELTSSSSEIGLDHNCLEEEVD